MEKSIGHVLKSNEVKFEGQFHLDAGQTAPGSTKGKNVGSVTPQVRIAENQSEFAVIEITCSCGTKTHVRCEYADVQSTGPAPDQTE